MPEAFEKNDISKSLTTADVLKLYQEHGLVGNSIGPAAIAALRCALCHIRRGEKLYGGGVSSCTGINPRKTSTVYNVLRRLEIGGYTLRQSEPRGLSPGPPKQFFIAAESPGQRSIIEIAAEYPVPETCQEVI